MITEQLITERTNLVLQRSGAKDQIEAFERRLGQVGFALQVLEQREKELKEIEAKTSADVPGELAKVIPFPTPLADGTETAEEGGALPAEELEEKPEDDNANIAGVPGEGPLETA